MDEFLKVMMKEITKDIEKGNVSKIKEQMLQRSIENNAVSFKSMYDAYMNVGFSETQAFELVKVQLSTMNFSR